LESRIAVGGPGFFVMRSCWAVCLR